MHHTVFPILSGKALVELAEPAAPSSDARTLHGFSIRYFDDTKQRWVMTQYWPNPNSPGVAFLDQLVGPQVSPTRIELFSYDISRSTVKKSALRRYAFVDIDGDRFGWRSAKRMEDEKNWTPSLAMDFKKTGPVPPLPAAGDPLPGFDRGKLCEGDAYRSFHALEGRWTGTVEDTKGRAAVRLTAGQMLDGCALALTLAAKDRPHVFIALGYSARLKRWVALALDDRHGTSHQYWLSETGGAGAVFYKAPHARISSPTKSWWGGIKNAAEDAGERLVVETLNENSVSFVRERRDGSSWRPSVRYAFTRQKNANK